MSKNAYGHEFGQHMKEKLLFIAPTVPLFDRNAGELRLFNILNILAKSYDITYLARYMASDNSVENDVYVNNLFDLGIKVQVGNYSLKNIFHSNRFKAAFLEFYFIAELYLQRIKLLQPSCPVIVDSVDVHYLRLHRKYLTTKDLNDLRIAEETKKIELTIYGQADITLTVTDDDARRIQKDNPHITVGILPSIHPLVYPEGDPNKNEIIFVGGFIHDPNIDAVLYFCEDILPRIRKVIPEVRFTIVGSNPPPQVMDLSNDYITVTGYVPSTTPYLQKSYVSVAPLRYGAGMKGKIGEAMAHGLPVVTTSVGAEGMRLIDRGNVLIADTPERFSNSVIDLMRDNSLYNTIQKNALEHISKEFSTERISIKIEYLMAQLDKLDVKKLPILKKISLLLDHFIKMIRK